MWAVLEGGGAETGVRGPFAGCSSGEHAHWWIEGGANLGDCIVATVVEMVQLVVKGEDMQVPVQVTVGACCERGTVKQD